jgi:hypothetical protein
MLSLAKHVMAKYKTLLMKMAIDNPSNVKAKTNVDLFCDVQVMFGFVAIFLLLHFIQNFIKSREWRDVFVCDLVVVTSS